MRIKTVEAWAVEMKLAEPYTIAYETVDHTTNVFMRVETTNGKVGYGCAAPDLEVTGETAQTVLDDVESEIAPSVTGSDPLRIAMLLARLEPKLHDHPSALALIDIALHDLMGRVAGVPLYKLLGGFRDRIKTSVTIGIMPERETVARAKTFIADGFRCLKLKGGADVDDDVARVLAVRKAVGEGVELRFDANQGYTSDEAVRFVTAVREAKLELVEQPTPRDQPHELGKVTHGVDVPIMADESLFNLVDAFRLARNDTIDMVNVKLMKAGGIMEAMRINSVSRAAGLEVMVGCMDEAALGIAAGLHFALSRPNVVYADLDGHLDLIGDPTAGVIRLDKGTLFPGSDPGLGTVAL